MSALQIFLSGRVETIREAETCPLVLVTIEETAGVLEFLVRVCAIRRVRHDDIALARGQSGDLTLASHFQPVMIHHAFGHRIGTDERSVVAR